ncbi:MAG: 30S ribosomal protein S6 [Ignavibacteria bacterium]|nr:30S ribosomal protein S6 [Ignavibacteria bacterium]
MTIRRAYESTYVINAALEDAEIEAVSKRVNDFITENGGQIVEENKWGRRRLAYPIKKKYNGFYVYMVVELPVDTLTALERFYVLEDGILRDLTIVLDPKLREFRKVRAEAQAIRAAQLAEESK